ncbi:MAG: 50S ribosomal protein L33 [Gemmatimonadota bacterium]
MREQITLECTECHERNYTMMKNKRKHPERVAYKKFCARCNAHRIHKETR